MKQEQLKNGTTVHYNDDGTVYGVTGSVDLNSTTGKYKSWVEGSKWDIVSIENEIRKFCHSNNLDVIDLHTEKAGWFRSTCFFEISGEVIKLNAIKNFLGKLKNEL